MCMEGPVRCKFTCCEQEGLSQLYREVSVKRVGRVLRGMERDAPDVCSSGALIWVGRYQVCSRILCGGKWLLSMYECYLVCVQVPFEDNSEIQLI